MEAKQSMKQRRHGLHGNVGNDVSVMTQAGVMDGVAGACLLWWEGAGPRRLDF